MCPALPRFSGFSVTPSTFLLVAVLSVFNATSGMGADWPQWRGPGRDGRAESPGLQMDWTTNPPRHLWSVEGMGEGYASLSAVGDRLYTTGNLPDGQSVICIDAKLQKVVWSSPMTSDRPGHSYPGARCTPSVDGDRLYAISSDGNIVCLNREDGSLIWKRSFVDDWNGKMMSIWGFSESPLVDGDRVLCTPGGEGAMMVALDKMTGREIWKTPVPYQGDRGKDGAGYSSIVISNAGGVKQYVQLIGRGLIGVRATDGKLLWGYDKVANDVANIPTPICFGDYIFASTGYQTGACLIKVSKARGGVAAKEEYFLNAKTFQNHHGGMIKDGDFIFAGHQHGKGFPICIHVPTGKVRWGGNIRPVGNGSASVVEVNDQLIFRYEDGTVALINANPRKYEFLGSFTPEYQERESWAHPVVVGDKLYLREQNRLMCYQL